MSIAAIGEALAMAFIPLIGRIFCKVQFAWRYLSIALVLLCIPAGIGYHRFIAGFCEGRKMPGRNGVIAVSAVICVSSLYFLDSVSAVPGWNKAETEYIGASNKDALFLFESSEDFSVRAEEMEPKVQVYGKSKVFFENAQRSYLSFETDIMVKTFAEGSYLEVGVMMPEHDCHIRVAYGENLIRKIADCISGAILLAILCNMMIKKLNIKGK